LRTRDQEGTLTRDSINLFKKRVKDSNFEE